MGPVAYARASYCQLCLQLRAPGSVALRIIGGCIWPAGCVIRRRRGRRATCWGECRESVDNSTGSLCRHCSPGLFCVWVCVVGASNWCAHMTLLCHESGAASGCCHAEHMLQLRL